MKQIKKNFFKRPTPAKILSNTKNTKIHSELWENIANLQESESLTIIKSIFPEEISESKDYLKNASVVNVPTYGENPDGTRMKPSKILKKTINSLPNDKYDYAGYVLTPEVGSNQTPRLFRLNDIAEAAMMYAYSPIIVEKGQILLNAPKNNINLFFKPFIEITESYETSNAKEKGASFVIKVPSRTKGRGKYTIRLDSLPVIDDKNTKHNIAYLLASDHVCEDKRHYFRFPKFTSERPEQEIFIDAHDILAYYAVIAKYSQVARDEKNKTGELPLIVPLQMNLVGIPSYRMLEMYTKMKNRVLIQENPKIAPGLLREGHLERLLWEGIIKEGYGSLFEGNRGEKIQNFDFSRYKLKI